MIDYLIEQICFQAASILPTENGPRCIALFDYESSEVGDLCFRQGDVIVLVEKQSDDWLRGELASKIGIFPTAFVRIVEDLPAMTTPVSPVANGKEVGLETWLSELHSICIHCTSLLFHYIIATARVYYNCQRKMCQL